MELFVIIVNDWKPLTIITKSSILDVADVLDPPLIKLLTNAFKKKDFLQILLMLLTSMTMVYEQMKRN